MAVLLTLQRVDLQLFYWCFQVSNREPVTALARLWSRSGDGHLHVLAPLLLILADTSGLQVLVCLSLALAIERPVYWLLKNSFQRYRPAEKVPGFRSAIEPSDRFSFPSGHSSAAFLLATVLFLVAGGPGWLLYGWASGVALSRVALGVHFPGDTLAGATIGATISIAVAACLGVLGA
jgi:undecaprenyl-diphosphatase